MDTLIAVYQQHLYLKNVTFSRIEHEDATVAIVYKVMTATGKSYILKICPRTHDYLHEVYFLQSFANIVPVPQIIQLIEPCNDVYGAILMEYLPNTLSKNLNFTNEIAHEIGILLAKIHLNKTNGYGDLLQPDSLTSNPRDYFSMKFAEGIDESKDHLPKALIEQCHTYYENHLYVFDAVDGPCIVHRDFRSANILIYNNKVQGIIDWSSARASFAEEDFCMLEHNGWSFNDSCKKSFLEGYGSIRPIPNYHAIMPVLRVSRAIAAIGFTVKQNTWNNSHAHLYEYNRTYLEFFLDSI